MPNPSLTLEQARNMLGTNKHRLDDELEVQAEMMDRIGQRATLAEARARDLKDELLRLEGKIYLELKADDPKLTVGELDAKVRSDRDRLSTWTRYQQALVEESSWVRMLDAWRGKGFDIKVLAGLYTSQYFAVRSVEEERPSPGRREADYIARRDLEAQTRSSRAGADQMEAQPRRRRSLEE